MPLYAIPAVIPYRCSEGPQPPLFNLHVEAVASTAERAVATAKGLSHLVGALRHGGAPVQVFKERATTGAPRNPVSGPYAYLLLRCDRVPHLAFPSRLDARGADDLGAALGALDQDLVFGLLLDLAPLGYISSAGLAALVEQSHRLNLHCFRTPEPIRRIIDTTGLGRHLRLHTDIRGAMDGLLHTHLRRLQHRAPTPARA
ncbi:MAG: STAS domain-containing protein [Planctomycetota bacterium]